MTAAVVLAGGAARRFGTDKTRATVAGSTLLERVVDAVEPLVTEVVVVGPWAPPGRRHLVEPDRFRGPLAGLAFGLRQVSDPHSLVLGGDHPLIERALLGLLMARQETADAVVPLGPSGPEPLVACYRTGVADHAEQLLADGERRLRSLLGVVDTSWLVEDEWRRVDPEGRSFLDVDRRADLELVRRSARPER